MFCIGLGFGLNKTINVLKSLIFAFGARYLLNWSSLFLLCSTKSKSTTSFDENKLFSRPFCIRRENPVAETLQEILKDVSWPITSRNIHKKYLQKKSFYLHAAPGRRVNTFITICSKLMLLRISNSAPLASRLKKSILAMSSDKIIAVNGMQWRRMWFAVDFFSVISISSYVLHSPVLFAAKYTFWCFIIGAVHSNRELGSPTQKIFPS